MSKSGLNLPLGSGIAEGFFGCRDSRTQRKNSAGASCTYTFPLPACRFYDTRISRAKTWQRLPNRTSEWEAIKTAVIMFLSFSLGHV